MSTPAPSYAVTRPIHVGTVELTVADAAMMTDFYEKAIGLQVLERSASGALLGAGGAPFLKLSGRPGAAAQSPRAAGLFHTAFLVPERAELGRWLAHAVAHRIPLQGASDHLVSEAIYLADPEGNGIEIYADRPHADWAFKPDGTVEMATLGLDLQALYDAAPKTGYAGMAAGTVVGHIHLQVSDIPAADGFYRDALGLDLMARYPGASFFASGGYHHHVAANIWNSRGAPRRPENVTGLAGFELAFADRAALDSLGEKLDAAGHETRRVPGRIELADPSGIRLTLSA